MVERSPTRTKIAAAGEGARRGTEERTASGLRTSVKIPPGSYAFLERGTYLSLAAEEPRFLEVEEECVELEGYQTYIVEFWVPMRDRLSDTVTVFTGDPEHKIKVCVINLKQPGPTETLPQKFEKNFALLEAEKARPKQSAVGTIMVTTLSTFSNEHNYILISDGDYEAHVTDFYLNVNLKRLGCTGRSALTLNQPSRAQIAKFHSLFKTIDTPSFKYTVCELVRYTQIALNHFGFLASECLDGFLCNETQQAISKFVADFGPFDVETSDVVLDPAVCAAILSKVVALRYKLNSLGHPVGKDPFRDRESFSHGIRSFQKSAKLATARPRILDKETVHAVEEAYESKPNPQPLKVHKAIKSKIEDFSGFHAVNMDIETTDIELFGRNVGIDPLKYLWKPRPATAPSDADWLHGGKEFGKSILKGVSGRKTRTSEAIKEFKKDVTGSLTRSFEGFVDKTSRRAKSPHLSKETPAAVGAGFNEPFEAAVIPERSGSAELDDSLNIGAVSEAEGINIAVSDAAAFTEKEVSAESRSPIELSYPQHAAVPVPRRSTLSNLLEQRKYLGKTDDETAVDVRGRRWSFHFDWNEIGEIGHIETGTLELDVHTFMLYIELKSREAKLRSLIDKMKAVDAEYSEKLELLRGEYKRKQTEHKDNREDTMQIVEKQESLLKMIKHLSLTGSKTQYELAVLEDKLRDSEECINGFLAKIARIEEQVADRR